MKRIAIDKLIIALDAFLTGLGIGAGLLVVLLILQATAGFVRG